MHANASAHRLCIAPMMDWTDRHCRFFHRLLTRRARLYTEMLTAQAVLRGDRSRLLAFDPAEHPVALQLGGCEPARLAEAARIGADFGYDEINLNVGCPSDRVQSGRFGAALMREPALVGECLAAMVAAVAVPVTVKCRLGVDDQDPAEALFALAEAACAAGVSVVAVHARKAWLQGLSPKENREIPPLDYTLAARLKRERPQLYVILNGGIASPEAAQAHLETFDGVMLGRAAYREPAMLGRADRALFGDAGEVAAGEAVRAYLPYVARQRRLGVSLCAMTRHILGLFAGQPGARAWRRILTVEGTGAGAGVEVIERALSAVVEAGMRREPAEAA